MNHKEKEPEFYIFNVMFADPVCRVVPWGKEWYNPKDIRGDGRPMAKAKPVTILPYQTVAQVNKSAQVKR